MRPLSDARTLLGRARSAVEGPDGPALAWTLRGYRPERLSGDVVDGLTVATLIVPLSIGYAGLAGLPPEMGLYASILPLIAYAVFGSGRRVILGPDAASASMIAATIAPLAAASDAPVRLASALGLLADFLSRPILVGYMAGVGVTVVAGQVEKILGGPAIGDALAVLGRVDWTAANPGAVASATVAAITSSGADLPSMLMGAGVLVAILVGKRLAPRIPMALLTMVVALALSAVLDLPSQGMAVLGPVPGGLPPVRIPAASLTELLALIPGALGLAILTFADTTATGRSFATRAGERTDANRELVALAVADAAGSLTGGYPVSSSPSRTAASEAAGSSSGLAGIVAAAAVLVVLLLLTGPLSYLPTPALGAVILAAVLGIIDVPALLAIWRVKKSEAAIALVAMGSRSGARPSSTIRDSARSGRRDGSARRIRPPAPPSRAGPSLPIRSPAALRRRPPQRRRRCRPRPERPPRPRCPRSRRRPRPGCRRHPPPRPQWPHPGPRRRSRRMRPAQTPVHRRPSHPAPPRRTRRARHRDRRRP